VHNLVENFDKKDRIQKLLENNFINIPILIKIISHEEFKIQFDESE